MFAASAGLSACSVITSASDYKIENSELDSGPMPGVDAGMGSSGNGTLDLTLENFDAHAGQPVDISVVNEGLVLQAHAITLLAPAGNMPLKPERITLRGVLPPGKDELFFFSDSNRNGSFDPPIVDPTTGSKMTQEHSWVVPVPANGVVDFVHATNFKFLDRDAITKQGDLVFKFPQTGAGVLPAVQKQIRADFETALGAVFELHVTTKEDRRQVGLIRRHAGSELPSGELRISGIADSGTTYDIELFVDGRSVQKFNKRAPDSGDLTVLAREWLPSSLVDRFTNAK